MKVELDLPEIEGYEYTGEYRQIENGDYYYRNSSAEYWGISNPSSSLGLILKKKAPKYKTTDIHTDNGVIKYVEIKALEDALKLTHGKALNGNHLVTYAELEKLLN